MYRVETDEWVQRQVDQLPAAALSSYAEMRCPLEVKSWSGEPAHAGNPDGAVRTARFGHGLGLVTYLILDDQRRVDVLQVLWLG